ncbi:MAG: class I SAM-dependent methyltransferase [Anaerolineaceae bacterium]|nr:class I SAM-dependent methyltransferase [Anaerolineaceae bacterium]
MKKKIDLVAHNRDAWNHEVENGNEWTKPVSSQVIADARIGKWELVLTPTKAVPRNWYPDLNGCDVLCLASGGGQQGPVLAAAGAKVTVFDNSPAQLAQDEMVSARDELKINLVQGDMQDLSVFEDESFDLIFHPVSNIFAQDVKKVWREAHRVLRPGGVLLAGITNPIINLFDDEPYERGEFIVKYSLPYSDLEQLSEEELAERIAKHEPLEFGHTLEEQIGGQLQAGFVLTDMFEDGWPQYAFDKHSKTFIATRAVKLIEG